MNQARGTRLNQARGTRQHEARGTRLNQTQGTRLNAALGTTTAALGTSLPLLSLRLSLPLPWGFLYPTCLSSGGEELYVRHPSGLNPRGQPHPRRFRHFNAVFFGNLFFGGGVHDGGSEIEGGKEGGEGGLAFDDLAQHPHATFCLLPLGELCLETLNDLRIVSHLPRRSPRTLMSLRPFVCPT
jgi:hypothetical protein